MRGIAHSYPEHRRPLVPDDREEQDEDGSVAPPQAQDGRAGTPSLSDDVSGNERELPNAHAQQIQRGEANLNHSTPIILMELMKID